MICPTCKAAAGQFGIGIRHNRIWCPECGSTWVNDGNDGSASDLNVSRRASLFDELVGACKDALEPLAELLDDETRYPIGIAAYRRIEAILAKAEAQP